jgi:predicted CoA-binding protein
VTTNKTADQVIDSFLATRRIAVVGATDRRERWGYKIWKYLRERGHDVVAVNPGVAEIDGEPVWKRLEDVPRPALGAPPVEGIDLVVNPRVGIEIARSAAELGVPIIFAQPGAESPEIESFCREHGLDYVEACVLVEGRARPIKPRSPA